MTNTHDLANHLFPRQRDFFDCSHKRKFIAGGRQSGKTTTLAAEALDAASDGDDVAFVTFKDSASKEACKKTTKLGFDYGFIHDAKRELIEVEGGGIIDFQRLRRGSTFRKYDLVVIDEIMSWDPSTIKVFLPLTDVPIYAAGTPFAGRKTLKWLYEEDFTRVTIPTKANPLVDEGFIEERKKDLDESKYRRDHLPGLVLNEHLIHSFEQNNEERTYECGMCDFKEKHKLGEGAPTSNAWVLGKAMAVDCGTT